MNNQIPSSGVKTKNITLRSILAWIIGFIFLFTGAILVFDDFVTGIAFLVSGALVLPYTYDLIKKKSGISMSAVLRTVIIVILFGIAVGVSSSGKKEQVATNPIQEQKPIAENNETVGTTSSSTPKPTPAPSPKPTVSSATEPVSSETTSQRNAVKKAKSYLSYSAFSHDGLVTQLEFEQFSHADAVYGADHSGANWNEQAAKKAKSYMEYSSFSRGGLIDQLIHEKFTREQAEYGVNAVGL
ncbi:MAG: hypothetical protein QG589_260 [Patescibacteria group bacterium]|nr:hypothetical protein [Patescibacteria group bacterium]